MADYSGEYHRYTGGYIGNYIGSDGADTFRGDPGTDEFYGRKGNDTFYGDKGNDKLYGGPGNDKLYGEDGNDKLYGEDGNDTLRGGKGEDRLYGDWLSPTRAWTEGQTLFVDRLEGDDRLYGEEGNDKLYGGPGNDQLYGGEGDDHLYGDQGDDHLYGGEGDDQLYDGEGDNKLYGGAGDDYLGSSLGANKLYGGEGDDTISGGWGDDHLVGGLGADNLHGGWGDDHLYGGKGNDHLHGGHLVVPDGGSGDDHLYGGEGSDILTGGPGADTLTGGSGTDLFRFAPGHSLGSGDVITDFVVAGANRDVLDLSNFNIDHTHDLESLRADGLTLSGLMDADGDGATDDRKITLPNGGTITLLNLGSAALGIDDFTFATLDGFYLTFWVDGGALTNVDAGDGGRSHLQEVVTSGGLTGRLDAGDLSIGGGVDLPASDDGLHRSNYHLYYRADGGSYFLRFDDAVTADLPVSATAAKVAAALEGLDGVTSAEVSGEPGNFTIALTADEPHVLQWGDLRLDGDGQLDYLAEPPADDGDGGALTNVDAGDEPEAQPDPDPEGDGGALTGTLINVEAGDEPEVLPPQKSILQQHLNLLELIIGGGASGSLDAGDLSIVGGVDLPASDDGLHRSSYHLYYRADGGSYFLRFDDAVTADLPVGATAAQVDAALEGLDGITSAEVTGEPGNFTIALTADEPHVLQWGDLHLDGDGSLDYLIA